jgi:hypothetical protein
MLEWWKKIVREMNSKGIPVPLVRDPKTGLGSVSLTLVFMSFNLVFVGLIGKYSKMLDGVDVSQAITLFSVCAALYFGRKMQKDSKGALTIEEEPKEPQKE